VASAFDEDREIRDGLSVLPAEGRAQLERVLEWPQEKRDELLRRIVGRTDLTHFASLVSMADTSDEVRLRLLRALRDLDT